MQTRLPAWAYPLIVAGSLGALPLILAGQLAARFAFQDALEHIRYSVATQNAPIR